MDDFRAMGDYRYSEKNNSLTAITFLLVGLGIGAIAALLFDRLDFDPACLNQSNGHSAMLHSHVGRERLRQRHIYHFPRARGIS